MKKDTGKKENYSIDEGEVPKEKKPLYSLENEISQRK